MKLSCRTLFFVTAATLFVAVCAASDMPIVGQDRGTNAESGASYFSKTSSIAATTGNKTASGSSANTTAAANAMMGPPVSPGNVTAPGPGNTTEALNGGPSVGLITPNTGPDLSSVVLPATMAKIDDEHHLKPYDLFVYQVPEDHDRAVLRHIDTAGNVTIPYLGEFSIKLVRPSGNMTLKEMCDKIQKELTDPSKHLYKKATPLAAFYTEMSEGVVYVVGTGIGHQGPVPVPPDKPLYLFDAVYAAGGFTTGADLDHVVLFHRNPDPDKKDADPSRIINVNDLIAKSAQRSEILEAGDTLRVDSKTETAGVVTIMGHVRGPTVMEIPAGGLTLSVAILKAGDFDNYATHTVTVFRINKADPNTPIQLTENVDHVRQGGADVDIPLQAGDRVFVDIPGWEKFFDL